MKLSKYMLVNGTRNIPLRIGKNKIGRRQIGVGAGTKFASRKQCTIFVKEKQNKTFIILKDSSLNGTFVDLSFVKNKSIFLNEGVYVGFGSIEDYFQLRRIEIIEID